MKHNIWKVGAYKRYYYYYYRAKDRCISGNCNIIPIPGRKHSKAGSHKIYYKISVRIIPKCPYKQYSTRAPYHQKASEQLIHLSLHTKIIPVSHENISSATCTRTLLPYLFFSATAFLGQVQIHEPPVFGYCTILPSLLAKHYSSSTRWRPMVYGREKPKNR